ncbi:uncharacterized protein LOC121394477 [Xenopus laevis]|uniref:Uncharacterized protein LOC121394477 n=1 Tax=Xenopus laevis TaxID=8355 RepID=A0A8J1KW91_XENLA|nr:uncharacterized protein LOC121394477 [Xenopus laevis]
MMSNLHIVLRIILLGLYHLCYYATSAVAQEEEAQSYYDDDSRQAINAQDYNEANQISWSGESQFSRSLDIREGIYIISIIILIILSTIGGVGWLLYLHLMLRQQPFFIMKTNELQGQDLKQESMQESKQESKLPTTRRYGRLLCFNCFFYSFFLIKLIPIPKVHFEDETKPESEKGLSEEEEIEEEEPKQAAPLKAPVAAKYSQIQFYKWKERTHLQKKHVVPGKDYMQPLTRITPCLTISEYNGTTFYKWKEKTYSGKEQALPGKAVLMPQRPSLSTAEHEAINVHESQEKAHSEKKEVVPAKAKVKHTKKVPK